MKKKNGIEPGKSTKRELMLCYPRPTIEHGGRSSLGINLKLAIYLANKYLQDPIYLYMQDGGVYIIETIYAK